MTAFGEFHRCGRGDPLLLIHGFTATCHIWNALPRMLADRFDVLAPTLPGHTGGPVLHDRPTIDRLSDGIEAMLDEVGWERAHLCGFSLGGWLALELAKRDRAISIIALSPGGAQGPAGGAEAQRIARLFARGRRMARAGSLLLPLLTRSGSLRKLALRDMMLHGDRVTQKDALRMIRAHAGTPVFDELLEEMGDSGGLTDLDRVVVPVHVVWAERDRVLPKRHAKFFRAAIPHATFHIVPRAGHVPFWDAPSEVVEQIRKGAERSFGPPTAGDAAADRRTTG